MLKVMAIGTVLKPTHAERTYDFLRCMRALEDAGLMQIERGPRGGLATATYAWLPPAYLPKRRGLGIHAEKRSRALQRLMRCRRDASVSVGEFVTAI
jgi:hypothetical protein